MESSKEVTTVVSLSDSINAFEMLSPLGDNSSCHGEQSRFLFVRYCFIGIFGFAVCVAGVIMNAVLLTVLSKLRDTYLIYLAALAVLDIAVAVTYIMVMSMGVLYEYLESVILYQIWYTCLPYFFTLSRIVTLASTYMVVVCTAERFLEVIHLAKHCEKAYKVEQSTRYTVIALVILLSAAFRLVVFWEVKVEINEHCQGTLNYYDLTQTWLVKDYYYSKVYAFWILNMVQVFFPFSALILLNALIVRKWRFALRETSDHTLDETKARVRSAQSARKMMAAIVSSYLVCNLLNLVVTFMEHIDIDFLRSHDVFYAFAADVVTMLTAVNATLRLPIYYASNFKIRTEIRRILVRTMIKPARVVYRKVSRSSRTIPEVSVNAVTSLESSDAYERFHEMAPLGVKGNGMNKSPRGSNGRPSSKAVSFCDVSA